MALDDGPADHEAQSQSVRFGGKGTIPTRDKDRWGIGYYYLRFSNAIIKLVRIRNREGSFFTTLRLCPGYTLHPTYRSSVHQEKLAARISILQ